MTGFVLNVTGLVPSMTGFDGDVDNDGMAYMTLLVIQVQQEDNMVLNPKYSLVHKT